MLPIPELYSDICIAWSISPSSEQSIVKYCQNVMKHVIHVCKAMVILDWKEDFIHTVNNNDVCIGKIEVNYDFIQ